LVIVVKDGGGFCMPQSGRWRWLTAALTGFYLMDYTAHPTVGEQEGTEAVSPRPVRAATAVQRAEPSQFMTHYHFERNHQGLENQLLRATLPSPHLTLCAGASV
jgi:hypothetical protein